MNARHESPAAAERRAAGMRAYWAKPENRAAASVRGRRHWADPEARERQSEIATRKLAKPEIRAKISERTRAAMADPGVRERQRAGLAAVWTPERRERQRQSTIERMALWRARAIEEAGEVLRRLPAAERDAALARITGARKGSAP